MRIINNLSSIFLQSKKEKIFFLLKIILTTLFFIKNNINLSFFQLLTPYIYIYYFLVKRLYIWESMPCRRQSSIFLTKNTKWLTTLDMKLICSKATPQACYTFHLLFLNNMIYMGRSTVDINIVKYFLSSSTHCLIQKTKHVKR